MMPQMHTIEIADGDRGAPVGRFHVIIVAHDLHGAGVAPCQRGCKRDTRPRRGPLSGLARPAHLGDGEADFLPVLGFPALSGLV